MNAIKILVPYGKTVVLAKIWKTQWRCSVPRPVICAVSDNYLLMLYGQAARFFDISISKFTIAPYKRLSNRLPTHWLKVAYWTLFQSIRVLFRTLPLKFIKTKSYHFPLLFSTISPQTQSFFTEKPLGLPLMFSVPMISTSAANNFLKKPFSEPSRYLHAQS